MKLWTICLAVPVAYLSGVFGLRLMESRATPRGNNVALVAPLEVEASGGPERADVGMEPSAKATTLVEMHVTTPAQVREVLRITRDATREDHAALVDAALHAEDPLVAGNAALALGRLGEFNSDGALLALVRDSRLRVRQDAVKACGLDGRVAALAELEQALGLDDAHVRPLIVEALGKIGGPEARALIQEVADDSVATKTERVFALAALERMDN